MSNLTRDEVKAMGFYELPHFTIGRSLVYDLGRCRHLSISSLGTPNEMVFLDEVDRDNDKEITNLIVIRNYDYDGPLTREILEMLLKALTVKTGHKAEERERHKQEVLAAFNEEQGEDDFDEEDGDEPDYYYCLSCGTVQDGFEFDSCQKCAGPTTAGYL